jgi:hypothetical protein
VVAHWLQGSVRAGRRLAPGDILPKIALETMERNVFAFANSRPLVSLHIVRK